MVRLSANRARRNRPPRTISVDQALRRYFITGLATLLPVAVTTWLLVVIFRFADGPLRRMLGLDIPGLGLLVTLAIILLVGVFSVHLVGRMVFKTLEAWLTRLPLIRNIYPAAKQLVKFLFSEDSRSAAFRRVVLVQYPRPGAYSIAFVTNETQTSVTGKPQTLLTLVIPNPPSPFTGPIILVPEEDVVQLSLSIEEAVKLIVSGGIVSAPLQAVEKHQRAMK